MKLTYAGLKDRDAFLNASIALPSYDPEKLAETTAASPEWVHFGIGNIFRIFIGSIADDLIAAGDMTSGITCVETFDFEVVDKDILDLKKWEKNGESEKDGNGVYVQYWHYDEDDVSFTATVEVKSDKLVNIGCGTTMSNFMEMTGDVNNSDKILEKTAQMAQAACGFPAESEGTLQDIFYRTTTGSDDSLWYSGYVFSLSTKKDEKDSKNNIMLFRVFPVTEELKTEWNLKEYTK